MSCERRQKIIETIWLFWAFALVGFDNAILGPCLPDLQSLVGASLEQMSYVFLVQGVGNLLGVLLGLALETRCDRRLLLAVYVLVGSVVNILIPVVPHFYYMLVLFLLQGVTKGQAEFGSLSLCNMLWKNEPLPFQFVVLGAGVSTFISSFIAQPFINRVPSAPISQSCQGHQVSTVNWTLLTANDSDSNIDLMSNDSDSYIDLMSYDSDSNMDLMSYDSDSNMDLMSTDSDLQFDSMSNGSEVSMYLISNATHIISEGFFSSDIQAVFFIVGSITLPAGLAFFYFYFSKSDSRDSATDAKISVKKVDSPCVDETTNLLAAPIISQATPTTSSQHCRSVVIVRVLVILLNFPVFGLLLTFSDLLTSIGMASPLCKTAVEASYFNMVLWGSAMMGRGVSAAIVTCVPMAQQLTFNILALVVTGTVMVVCYYGNNVAPWLCTAGLALFITPSVPGFITWSGQYVPITPLFINLCLCVAGVGEILLPVMGGQLMANYGSWYVMLFALMIMITMLVLFLLARYEARKINRR